MILTRMVTCRFYGDLNLFLPPERRRRRFFHAVKGVPSVKDTLEALGVPHTEIDCIVIDKKSVPFSHQIRGGENIKVYPDADGAGVGKVIRLKARPPAVPRFVLDAHLGKLTRHLRLLGFDTLYRHDISDEQIVRLTRRTGRVVLTRDIGLLKNRTVRCGYFVRSVDPKKQIKETVRRFHLGAKARPLRLCLECNGRIARVAKAKILERLPPLTKKYYQRFYICSRCDKIYWQGAHYKQLLRIIDSVT